MKKKLIELFIISIGIGVGIKIMEIFAYFVNSKIIELVL